jgi:hypothetical protein
LRSEFALPAQRQGVRSLDVTGLRIALIAACAAVLSGCGREKVDGVYRDPANPAVRYELRNGDSWSAEMVVEVPAGIFPHGAGTWLQGNYTRSGDVIELVCTSAGRRDPLSGELRADKTDPASYNHKLVLEDGALVPVGAGGEKEADFATDLNPLGARKLVPEEKPQ